MKRFLGSFFLFVILFALLGCQPQAQTTDSSLIIQKDSQVEQQNNQAATKRTIALVMKTLTNPFFVEMEKGARRAENELGIQLIVKAGAKETSIDQQIAIVEELIAKKVDAIVIAPGSSTELIPVLKKAQDAGIIIVNIDNELDADLSKQLGLVGVPFISVDNEQGAYLSARFISDQVKEPVQAAILEGIRTAKNAEARKNGAVKAFNENPNIKLVASETANWKIDEAYTVIEGIFSKYPDIKVIFCANDMMALGVIKYIKDTNKQGILVAGFDALDEAKNAIKEGSLQVTIDQQAAEQGYQGILFAQKALNGEKLQSKQMVDVLIVSKENLK